MNFSKLFPGALFHRLAQSPGYKNVPHLRELRPPYLSGSKSSAEAHTSIASFVEKKNLTRIKLDEKVSYLDIYPFIFTEWYMKNFKKQHILVSILNT